jgi:hypothetical protein
MTEGRYATLGYLLPMFSIELAVKTRCIGPSQLAGQPYLLYIAIVKSAIRKSVGWNITNYRVGQSPSFSPRHDGK